MTGKLTFTGPVGPGNSVTSLALTNLRRIEFDFDAHVVFAVDQNNAVKSFDIDATTTFTASVTAGVLVAEVLSQ